MELPLAARVAIDAVTSASVLLAAALVLLPRRRANAFLGLYLGIFALNSGGVVLQEFALPRDLAYGLLLFQAVTAVWFALAYLAFLGEVLDTPLTRPFRSVGARIVLGVAAAGIALCASVAPGLLVVARGAAYDVTVGWLWCYRLLLAAGLLIGLAGALLAVQRAHPGTLARRRAAAFLAAFVVLDVANFIDSMQGVIGATGADPYDLSFYVVESGLVVLAMALLVRGMLRDQLFDFDMRVKVGIRGGTLVALVLAIVVVVGEVVQAYTSNVWGVMAGGIAAGGLMLVQHPLQRAADRVAQAAMPAATGAPAYVQFKKLEVYRAAVESALEFDGVITERERNALDGLRVKLGIEASVALALEHDAGAPGRPQAA